MEKPGDPDGGKKTGLLLRHCYGAFREGSCEGGTSKTTKKMTPLPTPNAALPPFSVDDTTTRPFVLLNDYENKQ
jgi:hypothetical protein